MCVIYSTFFKINLINFPDSNNSKLTNGIDFPKSTLFKRGSSFALKEYIFLIFKYPVIWILSIILKVCVLKNWRVKYSKSIIKFVHIFKGCSSKGIFIYNDFESISLTLEVKLNLLFVSFLSFIIISIENDLLLNKMNWNNKQELFICRLCFL